MIRKMTSKLLAPLAGAMLDDHERRLAEAVKERDDQHDGDHDERDAGQVDPESVHDDPAI
jgi:hypothetical protein